MTRLPLSIALGVIVVAIVFVAIVVLPPLDRRLDREKARFSAPMISIHSQMSSGDDAGIFNSADKTYKSNVGEKRSNDLFDEIRRRLGAPGKTRFEHAEEVPTTDDGKKYLMTYRIDFEKGTAEETILLHWDSDSMRFRMLGYAIKSPLLPGGELSNSAEHR